MEKYNEDGTLLITGFIWRGGGGSFWWTSNIDHAMKMSDIEARRLDSVRNNYLPETRVFYGPAASIVADVRHRVCVPHVLQRRRSLRSTVVCYSVDVSCYEAPCCQCVPVRTVRSSRPIPFRPVCLSVRTFVPSHSVPTRPSVRPSVRSSFSPSVLPSVRL